jgi:signal transduction histidine kinase
MGFFLLGNSSDNPAIETTTMLRILVMLIVVSTAVIVVVFPLFYRKNLLQPLEQVLAGVQKVNAGDLQVNVPVEVNDEIGHLAHHFNLMTKSLRSYAEEMESLVARRTEELERSLEELKAAQTQLIQSEKMASLGELTAGIAHEIQNPLNFVNNFSAVNRELFAEMKEEIEKGNFAEVKAIATTIEGNEEKIGHHGRRADSIVKGMLQHARVSTGQKHPTNINALAEEYLRLSYQGQRAKDKSFNAIIQTQFDTNITDLFVVPQDIGRVLLNLYNNAFYAVQQKKKWLNGQYEPAVSVSTKKVGNNIMITVKDNGIGISSKVADKIFQPFFTTKPTGEGTGLGLSLSYDIITKGHGGTLSVQSTDGEGSEFVVELPAC